MPQAAPAAAPQRNPAADSSQAELSKPVLAADFENEARWQPLLGLPCELAVEVPLPDLTVSDFLTVRVGSVLATGWRIARDVPLRINGRLIGWGEFEVVGNRLAVRLTELV